MTARLKIKVVAGTLKEPAMLRMWEHVALHHDVEVFVQELPREESLTTTLPVVFFPVIDDMPNFFRDIETHLRGADVIVGVETSRLYSFQALRVARKLGVPFVCVVSEFAAFLYEKYANIRAIQRDVYENATLFLATSDRAIKLLELENVSKEKIRKIEPVTDPDLFRYSPTQAAKFRNYVGIPADAIVITTKVSLEQSEPCLTMFQGARLAVSRLPKEKRDKIRFLVCGRGAESDRIKYEVSDLGLGGSTLFLSQDPTMFLRDLMSATDVLIEGRYPSSSQDADLPWHVISGAYSGAKLVVTAGSIAADILIGQNVEPISDYSALNVAESLLGAIDHHDGDSKSRAERSELAVTANSLCRVAENVVKCLQDVAAKDERSSRRAGVVSFVKQHQVPVAFKEAREVLFRCEEVHDFSSECELDLYSEVLRIRGDALVALARGEEAVSAFENALKQNTSNHHALRGLGYLAWQGHSHEDALRFFKRALAVDPNDYQSLVGVGLVYRRLQMFDESVFWLQKAVAVGGLESASLSLLVQACMENPGEPSALAALEEVRDVFGDHPNLSNAIQKLESHQ